MKTAKNLRKSHNIDCEQELVDILSYEMGISIGISIRSEYWLELELSSNKKYDIVDKVTREEVSFCIGQKQY